MIYTMPPINNTIVDFNVYKVYILSSTLAVRDAVIL